MDRKGIAELLGRLAAIYPSLDREAAQKRKLLDAWEWLLAGADPVAVEEAARRWARANPDRPPRPGDLLAAAGETRDLIDDRLYGRYAALRRALQAGERLTPAQERELAEVERKIGLRPGATAASWASGAPVAVAERAS